MPGSCASRATPPASEDALAALVAAAAIRTGAGCRTTSPCSLSRSCNGEPYRDGGHGALPEWPKLTACPGCLVQVAVLRPDDRATSSWSTPRSITVVRELDDVVNVWLHIEAPDREAAAVAVREQLEQRLDPAERQLVLAVQAITTTR